MSTNTEIPRLLADAEALFERGKALDKEGKATGSDLLFTAILNVSLKAYRLGPDGLHDFADTCFRYDEELRRLTEDIEEEHQ